jgi:hypothetical protein
MACQSEPVKRLGKQMDQREFTDVEETSASDETLAEERMAEAVRLVVTRREQAPRSPKMERALKRLIWRYTRSRQATQGSADVEK